VIVKNLLNREKDVLTALLVFQPAIRRIVSTAKAFNKIQLIH
jgi:hypothetical protein